MTPRTSQPPHGRPPLRVVIGNAPQAYRDVVAASLQILRPADDVRTVAPADLDQVVAQRRPHVVVCSRLSDAIRTHALTWILLYAEGQTQVAWSVAGEQRAIDTLAFTFDDLLAIIDRTAQVVQSLPP